MADSAGAFYLALSQSLESTNAVAAYVTLNYAVTRLMAKLESNPTDSTTKSQVIGALNQLERKKQAIGPVGNCSPAYEDFLRQAKAANNPNLPHYVQALAVFGEIPAAWQADLAPVRRPEPLAPPPAAEVRQSFTSIPRSPGVPLSSDQLRMLERAKEEISDSVQELEFKKIYEGRKRLENALQMLSQLG